MFQGWETGDERYWSNGLITDIVNGIIVHISIYAMPSIYTVSGLLRIAWFERAIHWPRGSKPPSIRSIEVSCQQISSFVLCLPGSRPLSI